MKKFDPIKYDIDDNTPKRLISLSKKAKTSYKSSIKLFCLECQGYEYSAAKECDCNTCPLWASNKRIFRGKETYDD